LGTGFYGSNDPTNSVKALKEVCSPKDRLQSHQVTSPCYNTTHACNVQSDTKSYIHKNESLSDFILTYLFSSYPPFISLNGL